MVDRRSAGQAGALARTHGWQQAPAAGFIVAALEQSGVTSRPGQQLLPRSVGRRLPLPGQAARILAKSPSNGERPETPAKKHYVMCDTWRKEVEHEQKAGISRSRSYGLAYWPANLLKAGHTVHRCGTEVRRQRMVLVRLRGQERPPLRRRTHEEFPCAMTRRLGS